MGPRGNRFAKSTRMLLHPGEPQVEHCREIQGQYAERTKIYGESISDGWMARSVWRRANQDTGFFLGLCRRRWFSARLLHCLHLTRSSFPLYSRDGAQCAFFPLPRGIHSPGPLPMRYGEGRLRHGRDGD